MDCDEPNNGRMLWKVNIELYGENINHKLFKNGWNYINYEIDNLQISDDENKFYYIPVEGTPKLIKRSSNEIIDLKFKALSTASFLGNKFLNTFLLEVFDNEIIITNLENFTHYSFKPDKNESIDSINIIDSFYFEVQTFQSISGKKVLNSKVINLNSIDN